MNVLITGGAGFIGSHLVRRLVSQRTTSITVFDNLHRGRLENLQDCRSKIRLLRADVRDRGVLHEALLGIDIVYHLAAQSSVIGTATDLNYTLSTNVTGTLNLLQADSRTVEYRERHRNRHLRSVPTRPGFDTLAIYPPDGSLSRDGSQPVCRRCDARNN